MIEKLNGTTETVDFTLASQYPVISQQFSGKTSRYTGMSPGKSSARLKNTYNVTVAGEILYLKPHDILFIGSGELHSITAPKEGERYILNFRYRQCLSSSTSLRFFLPLYIPSSCCDIRSTAVQRPTSGLMTRMEEEYLCTAVFRDCELSSLMLHFFRNHRPQAPSECTA